MPLGRCITNVQVILILSNTELTVSTAMDRAIGVNRSPTRRGKNARLLELQLLLQQEPARTRQCHIWQRTMLAAWCDRKLFPREAALHEAAKRLTATTGASSRPQHTASLTATWSSVSDISDEDISRAARRRDTPLEALQRYWKLLRQRRIWTLVVACLIFLIAGAVPSQTALLFSQLVCSEKGYSERQCVDQKNLIPSTDADAIQAKASTMLAWANTATTTVAIFTSLLLSRASDFYGAKSSAPDIDGPEPACLEFLAYFQQNVGFAQAGKWECSSASPALSWAPLRLGWSTRSRCSWPAASSVAHPATA